MKTSSGLSFIVVRSGKILECLTYIFKYRRYFNRSYCLWQETGAVLFPRQKLSGPEELRYFPRACCDWVFIIIWNIVLSKGREKQCLGIFSVNTSMSINCVLYILCGLGLEQMFCKRKYIQDEIFRFVFCYFK
jgi:hypothetical protein